MQADPQNSDNPWLVARGARGGIIEVHFDPFTAGPFQNFTAGPCRPFTTGPLQNFTEGNFDGLQECLEVKAISR